MAPSSILAVTTAANAAGRRLCTLAALKAELSITSSATDAALEAKIDEASGAIADYCRRVFASEAVAETFRIAIPMDVLVLARWPITAIASVTCDGTALDASAYEHDPETGMLWRLRSDARESWTCGKVVVAYTAGYALPADAPPALSRACVILASTWWQSKGRDATIRSESTEGVDSVSYFDARNGGGGLPATVTDLIERYQAIAI